MNIPLGWGSAYGLKLLGGKLRRGKRGSGVFHEEFRASFGGRIRAGICMKYSMKLYRRLIVATWRNFVCKNIAINFKINLTCHYAKVFKIGKKLYV